MRNYNFILNSSSRALSSGPAGNPLPFQRALPGRPVDRVRETQCRMWPLGRPTVPGMDYHAGWRIGESRDVDYLDYFETDGGNFSLAIGDLVAGSSGSPGASLLASLHAMVRSLGSGPDEVPANSANFLGGLVQRIHEMFYEVAPEGSYATLFLARYDPIERRLDYCNAGHEAPVLLRKTGGRNRMVLLESGGPMVGVLRRSSYRQGSMYLHPGDILAAYTAGLTATRNPRGEEWGYRRLRAAIETSASLPPRDMVEQILDEAEAFSAPAPRSSDMTLWLGRLDQALSTHAPFEAEHAETVPAALPEPAALAA
jgi:sigma-B regulation protein RsbU (phosphoserine phosphatase)